MGGRERDARPLTRDAAARARVSPALPSSLTRTKLFSSFARQIDHVNFTVIDKWRHFVASKWRTLFAETHSRQPLSLDPRDDSRRFKVKDTLPSFSSSSSSSSSLWPRSGNRNARGVATRQEEGRRRRQKRTTGDWYGRGDSGGGGETGLCCRLCCTIAATWRMELIKRYRSSFPLP